MVFHSDWGRLSIYLSINLSINLWHCVRIADAYAYAMHVHMRKHVRLHNKKGRVPYSDSPPSSSFFLLHLAFAAFLARSLLAL